MAESLGATICTARVAKGMTQKQLAEAVKGRRGVPVSPAFIADLEKDRRVGSQPLLSAVELALGLEPDYLNAIAGRLPAWTFQAPLSPAQWAKVRSAIRKALPGKRNASQTAKGARRSRARKAAART